MAAKEGKKIEKVLELWDKLMDGEEVSVEEISALFDVHGRTVFRYMADIRNYLLVKEEIDGIHRELVFDNSKNVYRLVGDDSRFVSKEEMYAICKIVISSRAFGKTRMEKIIHRLLSASISKEQKEYLEEYLKSEMADYKNPGHVDPNLNVLGTAARGVRFHNVLSFDYKKNPEEKIKNHKVYPMGIVFSEYYFYLIAVPYNEKGPDGEAPRVYRLDRITNIRKLEEKFDVAYSKRFREGAFKNAVQFMFGGDKMQVHFTYKGPNIEIVYDRLPTAKAEKKGEGEYLVKADVEGTQGILMWLLSQGSKVNVVYPESLRQEWLDEVKKILTGNGFTVTAKK